MVKNHRAILALTAGLLVVAAVGFASLPNRTTFEIFVDRGSDSHRGERLLLDELGLGVPNVLVAIRAREGTIDGRNVTAEAREYVRRLERRPEVTDVTSYWTSSGATAASLRGRGGQTGLVLARILGDPKQVNDRAGELDPEFSTDGEHTEVWFGGDAPFFSQATELVKEDLIKAELLTAPLVLIALLFVFGSVAAALVPIGLAAAVIVGTGASLWALSFAIEVSAFATMVTTVLGIGLSIDYSLFVIGRFREELGRGSNVDEAVVQTVMTAGKTVLFSGIAVGIPFAAFLFFPMISMKAIGYGGMATALLAGIAGLVVLPALLAAIGHRINAGTVFRRSAAAGDGKGAWYRLSHRVMRRPLPIATALVVGLLLAGIPALAMKPTLLDDRGVSRDAEARVAGDLVRAEFNQRTATPLWIAVRDQRTALWRTRVNKFATRLSRHRHIASVETATGFYEGGTRSSSSTPPGSFGAPGLAYLSILTKIEPLSQENETFVREIRSIPSPFAETLATGVAPVTADVVSSTIDALPLALAFIAAASFLILLVQFGSVLAAAIAIGVSAISLSALMGAITLVFQDGNLGWLLNFEPTGSLYVLPPVIVFCIAFGLSMDYQVFVLSRIQEARERGHSNDEAIAVGLGRSGRIVTAAAVLIAIVFISAGLFSRQVFGQLFGMGLGLVVLVDAFMIRGTLVPALMKLAGDACWWGPAWLQRLRNRVGLSEIEASRSAR